VGNIVAAKGLVPEALFRFKGLVSTPGQGCANSRSKARSLHGSPGILMRAGRSLVPKTATRLQSGRLTRKACWRMNQRRRRRLRPWCVSCWVLLFRTIFVRDLLDLKNGPSGRSLSSKRLVSSQIIGGGDAECRVRRGFRVL